MRLFDKAPIHRDAVGILDFSYHDDAVKATDAVDVAQGVEHEVLVVLHVVGIHLDLEIVIASGVVAFRNLVYLCTVSINCCIRSWVCCFSRMLQSTMTL